jgi:DNA invertase Pin-like site-specific DNA recombinase
MVNLAIYVRVSTKNQMFERQLTDITNYIHSQYKQNEINIDIYAEKISGFKGSKDRPELTRFITKVEDEPKFYKCLYVTELSRVGRNPIDARTTVTKILEQGIDVCVTSTNGGSHFLNADGTIDKTKFAVLGLLMDFAQIEIDVFKSRASSGLKQKIFDGGATGGLMQPYGYLKDEHKKLVIDNEESKIIQFIFEQYKQGFGMGHIAKELNKDNIPTRTNKAFEGKEYKGKQAVNIKWTANQIYVILTNTIYYGKRIFKKKKRKDVNGKLIDNSEPFDAPNTAIISKKIFDECTDIRLGKKGNGRNIHTKNVILLQYLTTCGVCGRNYTHQVSDLKQVYVCSSRVVNEVKPCTNLGVNIDLVDSSIYNILCKSPTVLKYLNDTDSIKRDIKNKISLLETSIPFIENELKQNESKIDKLLDMTLEAGGSKERFRVKNLELETISNNLKIQLDTQTKQLESNKKSLKNLSKIKLDDSILQSAKGDRNKLQSIFKQIIKNVKITAINFQFIRLDVKLQINGEELKGILKIVVCRKGLRKKPFIYQYQDKFLSAFDPSEDIDEYYQRYYDDSMYDYDNVSELSEILAGFTTITDNLLQIHQDKNEIID